MLSLGLLELQVKAYIAKSFKQRLKIFATQEAHNLSEQASQVAWMYMVENGQMEPTVEKIWITAKDEKVCKTCGPLHGKVMPVTEQFHTSDGQNFWVPGVHVNCRCKVPDPAPTQNQVQPISKAGISYIDWQPDEHPRLGDGRFRTKTRRLTGTRTSTRW